MRISGEYVAVSGPWFRMDLVGGVRLCVGCEASCPFSINQVQRTIKRAGVLGALLNPWPIQLVQL